MFETDGKLELIFNSKHFLKLVVLKYLTALDWLRQEELQEVPLKNGYFQTDI